MALQQAYHSHFQYLFQLYRKASNAGFPINCIKPTGTHPTSTSSGRIRLAIDAST